MSISLLSTIVAAANATAGQPDPSEGDGNPFNYVPTGWICILFLVLFSLTTLAHVFQAVSLKVWYMLPTVALCGFIEILGWSGRYWGHVNTHSSGPFMMQICTTIMAPSFMTAAMFLILPRIVSEVGQEYSRMPPRLYLIIFLTADVTALVLQAIGGALASIADTLEGANRGGNIMLAGIVIQLAAVTLFDLLSIEFAVRFALGRPARKSVAQAKPRYVGWGRLPRGVPLMLLGLAIASVFILVRSIYRTIELTDGWNGTIISTEKWFNWFDGAAVLVAMLTFNVLHPGYLIRNFGNRLLDFGPQSTEKMEKTESLQP
ncbi:RTA1-domain-containing protein [Ceratobasidium sp. AG-I]|nr:RTA1-domain-containing protein [Ceratobasidium sp. AG-I]